MNLIDTFVAAAERFLPLLGTIVAAMAVLYTVNRLLTKRWKDSPNQQFRFQLIMLALTFSAVLIVILALPVTVATRGQLLSLIGILLSAAIALSSTTFIGNMMAGIMLRAVKSARPGDFIIVADLTGRITEMGLLHTEVQTEFRDLATVPNLYMVTQPVRVVRPSGTIITAEVSLGYDVSHVDVSAILIKAVARAGLGDGFVHVRELGDFSITYRAAGLLVDVTSLISARSVLREAVLDSLHEAGIEIVSPNFMNTRAMAEDKLFVPATNRKKKKARAKSADDVVFDKAAEAASAAEILKSIEDIDAQIASMTKEKGAADSDAVSELAAEKARLAEQLKDKQDVLDAE